MMVNILSSQEFCTPPQSAPSIRILALARGLREIGVHVQIITKRLPSQPTFSTIHDIPLYRPWTNFVDPRAYVRALLYYGRSAAVSHIRGIPLLPGVWVINRFLKHRPLVIDGTGLYIHACASPHFHLGYRPEAQILRPIEDKWAFEKALLDRVDRVLCTTHAIRNWYTQSGISSDKLRVIPLGVDTTLFNPATVSPLALPAVNPKHPVITYIGGTQTYQGLTNLIQAIPLVLAAHPTALFLLGLKGTTSQLYALQQKLQALHITNHVILHTNIPHQLIPHYLKRSNIVIIPMLSTIQTEMFSAMKLMEALAMGVPIVATRLQATQEIVKDHESAILVPQPTPDYLATALNALLDNPDLRTRLSHNARQTAQQYNWAHIANQHKHVYQELV